MAIFVCKYFCTWYLVENIYFSAAHILSRKGMKGMNPHHQQVHRAPSSETWPPPWSASLRGWSGDGTARGQAWCCRHFVIELQDLNEVMETSLVLGVLAGLVHGEDISLAEHLLSLLGGSSDLGDGLEGGVQVA